MSKFEEISVNSHEVVCDGGGGAVGHPKVYLHINQESGNIVCPYCSRNYILNKKSAKLKSAH